MDETPITNGADRCFVPMLLGTIVIPDAPRGSAVIAHWMEPKASAGNENYNSVMRAENVRKVLKSIEAGTGGYGTISEDTNLSIKTVQSICLDLMDAGKICRVKLELRLR